jgi:hypothetical protein
MEHECSTETLTFMVEVLESAWALTLRPAERSTMTDTILS